MLSFTRPDLLDMRYLLCQRTRSISGRTRHEFSVGGSIIFCKKRMHAAILCYSHPCRVCWIHVLHQTSRWFVCCQVNWHHQDTSIHRRHWRYSVGLESAFLLEKTLLGTAMHRGTRRLPKDWTTVCLICWALLYRRDYQAPRLSLRLHGKGENQQTIQKTVRRLTCITTDHIDFTHDLFKFSNETKSKADNYEVERVVEWLALTDIKTFWSWRQRSM